LGWRFIIDHTLYKEFKTNNMRKLNSLITKGILLFVTITSLSCSTSRVFQSECESLAKSGYIDVTIWDSKKGANYSIEQARKDAIHTILYSGIAGSKNCSSQPPILNSDEERSKFDKIQKDFFSKNGQWTRYTTSAKKSNAKPETVSDKNWNFYTVTVAKQELRKYLEEQKIINSLTKGF